MRIDARGLGFEAGGTRVLAPVSLSLRPGELVGLLGPSGAGKSTLLKLLSGVSRDGDGQVLWNGQDLVEGWEGLKDQIGFVPQDDVVHTSLTPRDELTFGCRLRCPALDDAGVDARVGRVLAQVELEEAADRRIDRLSGGQRKRVSLGLELLTEPPALFLDEPTSGLDPALETKMMELFRRLAREGRTVVVTTHVMESLEVLDLVLIMMKGRLVFLGPPAEAPAFFGAPAFPEIYARLAGCAPEEWETRFKGSSFHAELVARRLAEPPGAGPARIPAARPGPGATAAVAGPTGASGPSPPKPGEDAEVEALLQELKRNR